MVFFSNSYKEVKLLVLQIYFTNKLPYRQQQTWTTLLQCSNKLIQGTG